MPRKNVHQIVNVKSAASILTIWWKYPTFIYSLVRQRSPLVRTDVLAGRMNAPCRPDKQHHIQAQHHRHGNVHKIAGRVDV